MRTLLIDNYDSFTYNLYQLISEVNGVEPTVVRNDEARTVAALGLSRFDNVVISPGPGRPDVARDVGISAAVIAETDLPLLGVCLGHQGIVVAAGGVVGPAPTARHGYLDRIDHDNRDVFAGLPAGFVAVRYHSLCARRPLPDDLAITATAADGVVMGVRHRTRPQWGVQFHPESIASEFGAALLRNFAGLTAAHHESRGGGSVATGALSAVNRSRRSGEARVPGLPSVTSAAAQQFPSATASGVADRFVSPTAVRERPEHGGSAGSPDAASEPPVRSNTSTAPFAEPDATEADCTPLLPTRGTTLRTNTGSLGTPEFDGSEATPEFDGPEAESRREHAPGTVVGDRIPLMGESARASRASADPPVRATGSAETDSDAAHPTVNDPHEASHASADPPTPTTSSAETDSDASHPTVNDPHEASRASADLPTPTTGSTETDSDAAHPTVNDPHEASHAGAARTTGSTPVPASAAAITPAPAITSASLDLGPGSVSTGSPLGDETRYSPVDSARRMRLLHTVIDRAIDTEAAFVRLYGASPTAFWLDSEHVEPGLDRFSFLGDASGPLAEVVRYRVGDGAVIVETAEGGRRTVAGDVLDYLAAQLRAREVEIPELPFDFACGYVGYLGYEVKADCGAHAAHRAETPDAQWIFADRLVVVDHVAGHTHLLALTDPAPESALAAADWLRDTREVLGTLPTWSNPPELEVDSDTAAVEALLTRGRERYLTDIAICLDRLRAGESYEICLTDGLTVSADIGGLDFYRVLRRCNPAPYAAYLRFDDLEVACSSPERFLKIDRARTVESKPIKGTAPRGATPAEDERLRRELAEDPKTRAENLMIVDLLRNDLGRVCQIGSVHVPNLMATETYTTLHQLVSTVRGTLRPGMDVIDCLRACFPGGSMTGAPKLRTMEIIDELETEARGVYSGTIGFLGLGGTADLNIVIRTAVRHAGRWRIGAGGAIVLDSDPESEFREMLLKAAATYRALGR